MQSNQNSSQPKRKFFYLQWRSMNDRLLLTGMPEREPGPDQNGTVDFREDREPVLREVLTSKMKFNQEILFDRQHRLGIKKIRQTYPRPIISKFHRLKDRERVRRAASKVLNGTTYGVREQFLAE